MVLEQTENFKLENSISIVLISVGPTPSILQEVNIPIWTNQACRTKYGPAAPGGIVESFLCAGKEDKDSCSVSDLE